MPVLSLPEFLGLQEAPQAPVFQRTNQLRRPTDWERFAQTADAVTALRQQRPMAQIQAIQNEYDTIRDNADKLRREREATMQAEQAVSALAGLTPESDDYLTQRRRIMTQFPSAVLDPRVQSVIDDSDRMFNTRQSAMARMEEERLQAENRRAQEEADRRAELASLGVFDPNERARLAKSSELTGEEKFRRSQKPEGVAKDKALDTIINQAFAEFDAQYMPPEGMSDPTEIAIDKSAKKYALNQRLLERFGAAKQQETAPTPTTAPQIQTPFRPGVAPAEVAPPPVVPTPATQATLEQEISRVPVTQQAEWLKRRKEQETETQRINEEWTKARNNLESMLKQKYPDKPYPGLKTSPLEQLAMQIAGPEPVMVDGDIVNPETGAAIPVFIGNKVLSDLGLGGGKVAFEEPGSRRKTLGIFGSQKVEYEQLLKDWAQRFLESRNIAPTGQPTPLLDRQPEKIIQKADAFLNQWER